MLKQSANLEQMNMKDFSPVATKNYELLVGYDKEEKPIIINVNKNPHLLIVGDCRMGKSKLLQQIITNIIYNNPNVEIYLSQVSKNDLKPFIKYNNVGACSNGFMALESVLNKLTEELKVREEKIYNMTKNFKGENIEDYNKLNKDKMEYIYLILDDYNDLIEDAYLDNKEIKETKRQIQNKIASILQFGGKCGIQVIISTILCKDFMNVCQKHLALTCNKLLFRIQNNVNARMLIGGTENCYLKQQYFILNNDKKINGMTYNINIEDIGRILDKIQ